MSSCNTSIPQPLIFVLAGIPGLDSSQGWLSVPFFLVFVAAVIGNATILCIVRMEESLHEPMFLFLAVLSAVDLSLVTVTVPRMLGIFWMNAKEISFSACLTQMFFIPLFYVMESGILLAMAFDRFVAIWHPLRYTTILSNNMLVKIALAVLARAVAVLTPAPILAKRLGHFQTHVIAYSYCFMAVVKLACVDTGATKRYSLSMATIIGSCDAVLIAVSYVFILRSVFHLPSQEARFKALGTCGSHVCVILVFYSTAGFSIFTHRFGKNIPAHIHIFIANMYLLVPPFLNPIVYGVRTKKIRELVLKTLMVKGV
uniref:Olfactory receptor n=1 Tax=Sus scrofa TaxID=9823 RepID=A0A8D1DEK9_PIG